MARPRRVDTELVAKAQELALQANTLEALRAGGADAGAAGDHAGADGCRAGCGSGNGGAIPVAAARSRRAAGHCSASVGWPAPCSHEPGGGKVVP
jgi:hypothetical protein